jgi:hypothetical protein
MCPPRRKIDVWKGQDGQPQTVYVCQQKSGIATEGRAKPPAPNQRRRRDAFSYGLKATPCSCWANATRARR